MECKNHPTLEALDRCAGCAEAFCDSCLVPVGGQKYCASCKVLAVRGVQPATVDPTLPCKEANEALTYSIIGIFCFGIVLEPVAISKALEAKKKIALNPELAGAGKATAAIVIASIALALWVLGIIAKYAL